MTAIVTIGGGSFRSTLKIDREIVRLTKKKHPNFLFIPTASSDSEQYSENIGKHYKKLGCKTDVLYLLNNKNKKETKTKINKANIIYVGGGNTLKMMRRWRFLGVDTLLKKAWKKGTVLCGLSAGSICWYDSGHSDSMAYYQKKWKYINVKGLGLIKGIHCPHYDSATKGVPRKKDFQKMIKKIGGTGIAIENSCAIAYINNTTKVIQGKKTAKAFTIYKKNGKVVEEPIE